MYPKQLNFKLTFHGGNFTSVERSVLEAEVKLLHIVSREARANHHSVGIDDAVEG